MPRSAPRGLVVVAGDPRSLAGQIVDAIHRKIPAGELAVGEKPSSVRELAQQLAINPNTVSMTYAELAADGWLRAQAGLGSSSPHSATSSVPRNATGGSMRPWTALSTRP